MGIQVVSKTFPKHESIDVIGTRTLSTILLLREKFPYSEFFWSVFSPNAGKYGPEKLRIRTLFTWCLISLKQDERRPPTMRKNCLYSELFQCAFSGIQTKYKQPQSISRYSVQMRENADQNSPEQGHFSCSAKLSVYTFSRDNRVGKVICYISYLIQVILNKF